MQAWWIYNRGKGVWFCGRNHKSQITNDNDQNYKITDRQHSRRYDETPSMFDVHFLTLIFDACNLVLEIWDVFIPENGPWPDDPNLTNDHRAGAGGGMELA